MGVSSPALLRTLQAMREKNSNQSGTTPPQSLGKSVGDRYDQVDSDEVMLASWVWDGMDWIQTTIGSPAINDLDTFADDQVFVGKLVKKIATADLFVGEQFIGGRFTGGIFETTAAANRGIKLHGDTNTLKAWNASGTETFSLNGTTGALSMVGDLRSGSTIEGATVRGGRFEMNGEGSKTGFDIHILNDALGGVINMRTPQTVTPGTIRASYDQVGSYDQMVLFSPSTTSWDVRGYLKVSSGRSTAPTDDVKAASIFVGGNLMVEAQYGENSVEGVYNQTLKVGQAFGAHMKFATDATAPLLRSMTIYDRTYTATANLHITSAGTIGRISSTRASKLDIKTLDTSLDDRLLSLRAATWIDRGEAEALAEHLDREHRGLPLLQAGGEPWVEAPNLLRRIPGMIAEEVIEAGLPEFAYYNEAGEPEGLMYERIAVALIPVVARLRDRIITLEQEQQFWK